MKKLLVAGMPRIWQLAHVFRDGERSATHHPEFSMLEWYRAGASWRELDPRLHRPAVRAARRQLAAECFGWRDRSADAQQPWHEISVAEAFRSHCRIDILATAPDPLDPRFARCWPRRRVGSASSRIRATIGRRSISASSSTGSSPISASARRRCSTISRLSMAALSRRNPADPRLAERFELYVCGLELANAFGELTDPAEQRARFLADQAKKQALYGETYPIDEDFLAALEYGLPPSRRHRARLRPPGHARHRRQRHRRRAVGAG